MGSEQMLDQTIIHHRLSDKVKKIFQRIANKYILPVMAKLKLTFKKSQLKQIK